MKTLIKHFDTIVFSASLASCLAIQAKAATFHASIDNFSLLMPPSITNKLDLLSVRETKKVTVEVQRFPQEMLMRILNYLIFNNSANIAVFSTLFQIVKLVEKARQVL